MMAAEARCISLNERCIKAIARGRGPKLRKRENTTASMECCPNFLPKGPWTHLPGSLTVPQGFQVSSLCADLRSSQSEKGDLALVFIEPEYHADCSAAAVFTQNVMMAAPVEISKSHLSASKGRAFALLVNAGQANAATGSQGINDAKSIISHLIKSLPSNVMIKDELVLIQSTGVIGQRIKMENLLSKLSALTEGLGCSVNHDLEFAEAVTTTDTVTKSVALEVPVPVSSGSTINVRIGGVAKGAGMIHPNMATMLSTLTTDAKVAPEVLQIILRRVVEKTFNQVSVDADTSTNDCVVCLASGASCPSSSDKSARIDSLDSPGAAVFEAALCAACTSLAKGIAWDGEGAHVLIQVSVTGTESDEEARVLAKSIIASNLVKSAIFGADPNWGRIACAAGYSGVDFDPSALSITLGKEIMLMQSGQPVEFDGEAASEYLRQQARTHDTVDVSVSVGHGFGQGCAWGCDLSYDYVRINAEYTT